MTPERIEQWRQVWAAESNSIAPEIRQAADEKRELCELALDGLRFRAWCEGASYAPGELASLLAHAIKPEAYRAAIDQFIVNRAKRKAA